MIDGRQRKNVEIGLFVEIVQKPHQRSGELTEGVIAKIKVVRRITPIVYAKKNNTKFVSFSLYLTISPSLKLGVTKRNASFICLKVIFIIEIMCIRNIIKN